MVKHLSGACLLIALLTGCGGGGGASHSPSYGHGPDYGQAPEPSPSDPSTPNEPPATDEPTVTSEPPTTDEPTDAPATDLWVDGIAVLQWSRPDQRENGEYLEVDDIGGYEVRYRKPTEQDYQVIRIPDGWAESYEIISLQGNYQFQVAAFDRDGLYSEFVEIHPY